MKQHLVLQVIGDDRAAVVKALLDLAAELEKDHHVDNSHVSTHAYEADWDLFQSVKDSPSNNDLSHLLDLWAGTVAKE